MTAELDWNFLTSVAENYERNLVPIVFAPWADELVETAALRQGDRVLDVACGTGIVARIAARKLGNTAGVVGVGCKRADDHGRSLDGNGRGHRHRVVGSQRGRTALPEAAFDVVLCQSGLQFFPDRSASLREMRRVLKPGGRLILSVWGPIERSRGFAVAADAVARHIGPEAARPITLAFDLMTAQSRGLSVVSQPTNRVPRVCGHAERSISDDEPN